MFPVRSEVVVGEEARLQLGLCTRQPPVVLEDRCALFAGLVVVVLRHSPLGKRRPRIGLLGVKNGGPDVSDVSDVLRGLFGVRARCDSLSVLPALLRITNDRSLMGEYRNGWLTNTILVILVVVAVYLTYINLVDMLGPYF